jgi:adenylylsulfate kinase
MPVKVLELDLIRRVVTPAPQYTAAERDIVYRALGHMAVLLAQAGVPVIVDATGHRRVWRDLVRAAVPRFAEVQLVCPLELCRERECRRVGGHAPRAVYAQARRPGATVPGVNVAYEPALAPELVVDTAVVSVSEAAARVAALAERLAG